MIISFHNKSSASSNTGKHSTIETRCSFREMIQKQKPEIPYSHAGRHSAVHECSTIEENTQEQARGDNLRRVREGRQWFGPLPLLFSLSVIRVPFVSAPETSERFRSCFMPENLIESNWNNGLPAGQRMRRKNGRENQRQKAELRFP